jgi:hypothetical protein
MATPIEIDTIEARRVDDTTRQMMAEGVSLSWAQVDALGDEAIDWLTRRLGLTCTTDDKGITCTPAGDR